MYIIIVGGGEIGYYLSKALLDKGHEVLVIEKDSRKVGQIEEELGSICLQGNGSQVSTLEEAGARRANLLIAVTEEDEENLIASQIAKHKFNVPRTIARLDNPMNEALFKKLGIDVAISSTRLILEVIEREVSMPFLTRLSSLKGGEVEIVEVKIPPTSAKVGKQIKDLPLPEGSNIFLLIRREESLQMPMLGTVIEAGDRLMALIKPDSERALHDILTSS